MRLNAKRTILAGQIQGGGSIKASRPTRFGGDVTFETPPRVKE